MRGCPTHTGVMGLDAFVIALRPKNRIAQALTVVRWQLLWHSPTLIKKLIYCTCKIHRVSKQTSHLWLAITLMHVNGFWFFFGRNVTDKVGNQKTLYYATSNNLCFCTTCQNGETWKSHFSLNWDCVTHTMHLCAVFLKEKIVICDVFVRTAPGGSGRLRTAFSIGPLKSIQSIVRV